MAKKFLLLLSSLMMVATVAMAQPANDNCANATNLGTLPTPNPCGGPPNTNPGIGSTLTFNNQTNVGATGPQPYTTLLGCQGGGNQPGPAADVWYQFTATANEVYINVSGGLSNPSIALWSGTCGNLTGRGCANGNATSVAANFDQIVPGQVYYIQVSGNTLSAQGTFTLTIHNDNDCNDCLVQSNLTVNPPPTNGTYLPGTQVQFCYTITNWRQSNTNWLHGVVPTFGPAWNMATLGSFTAANSCDGQGIWSWFNSTTSTATGQTFGPGFFYDRDGSAAPGIQTDGNAGNNFGDNCQGAVNWTFCWTITTAQCPPAANNSSLNVSINTLGDGESGSWNNIACQQDPVYQFSAILRCCQQPLMASTNVPCASGTTGTATATGQGTGPYNYVWSNGQTFNNVAGSSSINNLPPGTYTVTVTDLFDNCTTTQSVTITAPTPVASTETHVNVACFGGTTGSINLTPSGGSPNYTYNWGGGVTTEDRTNLAAGTYTVTITDSQGCTSTRTVTITQPATPVSATAVPTNVACFGGTTGSINLTPSGGTPNYTFNWGGGVTTEDRNNLAAGTYTVTVTDLNGCTTTQSATITQPTQVVVNGTTTPVACNGGTTGTASASGSGGTGTITYQWSNGGTGSTINNLPAGTYTVTATDANGCTGTTQVTVAQPTPVVVNAVRTNVNCNGGTTGTATASGSGGTGTISYQWSNGGTTATINNLPAGTYTVTATDANGCTATTSVTVTQPTPVVVNATNTNVACSGGTNGTASATGSGGTGTITYQWSTGATTQNISNLGVGTYTVTATDANGCTATTQVTVTQAGTMSLNATFTNVSCNGANNGTASATGTGGTGTITYLWSNGATTQNINSLPAGTYTVTATDQNGCTATTQVTVTQPSPVTVSATSTNVSCNGAANGTASASGLGGTGTISYVWSNGATTATVNNLANGTYTVTATDQNGCTATTQVTVTQPTPVTVSATNTNVSCNGAANGTASASGLGGTGTISYVWSNGATAATIGSLAPGTYTVTATDANGCTATTQVTVTQPSVVTVSATSANVNCNGANNGTASASGLGGTGTIGYQWSNGGTTASINNLAPGTYTVTATDANGCTATTQVTITQPSPVTVSATNTNVLCNGANTGTASATGLGGTGTIGYVWSNGGTSATISNLAAGTYTVTATDANGCTATTQVTVTQPAAMTLSATNTNVSCNAGNNGTASATGLGGAGTISYVWSNGGTTSTISNLTAGTYTVTATDANGCTATTQVTVTQPTAVTVSATSVNVNCNGANNGTASATGLGGTGTIGYAWSNGGTTATISNLTPGTYTVTATDLNGCNATTQVTITQPTPVTFTTSAVQALCGASNGSASVNNPSGGTGTYTYLWSNGQTTQTATSLAAGTYNVTVTDQNGCTATGQAIVTSNSTMTSNITAPVNVACNGGATGSATAAGNGGSGTYTYIWSNGQTTATATGLAAGTYTVTVTDANQCQSISQVTITEPTALTATTAFTPVICFGGTTGTASATPAGGTGTYSYAWSNGGNTATISNISVGTYTVTVTDQNGCTTTQSVNVTQPTQVTVSATNTNVSCNAGSNGTATATGSGGSGTLTYAWSNGGNTATISNLIAGTYTVTTTDANGCTASTQVTVTQPTLVTVTATSTNASCNGAANGTATASGLGGTGTFTYAWSNGGTTATISNLAPGTYTVTATDQNGCTATAQVTTTQPSAVTVTSTATNVDCNGAGNGTASASGLGGTGTISYAWSNGGTTATISNLVPGTYTVTVTDQNGCTATSQQTITQPTAVTLSMASTMVNCNGAGNGTATATFSGGTGALGVLWNTGATTATISNLAPGTYTATVTDQNGCTISQSVTITQPTAVAVTATSSNVTCNGAANGTATASGSGGTGTIGYAWSNGGNTATISNLAPGTYTVTATDANGCTSTNQVTITQPTQVTVQANSQPVLCFGGNTGSATAAGNGGTGTISYAWSNGQSGITANNLTAGTYTVTATDQNGCTASQSVVVTQPTALVSSSNVTANVDCFGGSDGSATVAASGGMGGYTYTWSTPLGSGTVANNLPAGTYSVTVTDLNNCVSTTQFIVTQPAPLTLTAVATPVNCYSLTPDGTAGVTVSGGTGPYTYFWSNGQTGPYLTGLTDGTYTVTVTDANGCTATATMVVGPPVFPTVVAGPDVSFCEGSGGAQIIATAGNTGPGYYFQWWCNAVGGICGIDSVYDNDPFVNPTQSMWYYVQVFDHNGCASDTDSVYVNVLPKPIVDAGEDKIICGDSAPCVVLTPTISAAPGPYTYLWMPAAGLNNPTIPNPCARPDTTTIYALVVTSSNGCTSEYTTTDTLATVTVFVNPVPIADAGPDHEICFGDTAQLPGVGYGAGPDYQYEWSPSTGLSDSSASTTLASPPATTIYTLVVWSNGCPSYGDPVTVEVHTIPTIDAGWDREACYGDTVLIDAMAGGDSTTTYTYVWTPSLPVVGGDDEDALVAPTQTTTFYVQGTSTFGCRTAIDSMTVYMLATPVAEAGPNQFFCQSDAAQLQGSYTFATAETVDPSQVQYVWTPPAGLSSTTQLQPTATPDVSTFYYLTVTAGLCSTTDSVLVSVGAFVDAVATADTQVVCAGDSIHLSASGSAGANIQWTPSTGVADPNASETAASPGSSMTYWLVMGSGGCLDSMAVPVQVIPSPQADFVNSALDGCAPHQVSFTQTSQGGILHTWNFGDGSPVSNSSTVLHTFDAPGTYPVTLVAVGTGGCADSAEVVYVNVGAQPVADFITTPEFPVEMSLPNTDVTFIDKSENAVQWLWEFGDGNSSNETNPQHAFDEPGAHFVTLTVTSSMGCVAQVVHGPFVVIPSDLFIPNVFSPNGDGVNDIFLPEYSGSQPYLLQIFDRWGAMMYDGKNRTEGWNGLTTDGEPAPDGVYFYRVTVGPREFVGNVTLMR